MVVWLKWGLGWACAVREKQQTRKKESIFAISFISIDLGYEVKMKGNVVLENLIFAAPIEIRRVFLKSGLFYLEAVP
jgi:hypothetical protein